MDERQHSLHRAHGGIGVLHARTLWRQLDNEDGKGGDHAPRLRHGKRDKHRPRALQPRQAVNDSLGMQLHLRGHNVPHHLLALAARAGQPHQERVVAADDDADRRLRIPADEHHRRVYADDVAAVYHSLPLLLPRVAFRFGTRAKGQGPRPRADALRRGTYMA